jgi:hypothetical protein
LSTQTSSTSKSASKKPQYSSGTRFYAKVVEGAIRRVHQHDC